MSFTQSLLQVAAVLTVVGAVGWGAAAALVPAGARAERLAWGFAAGLTLTALSVPLAFALRIRPGWLPFLVLAALAVLPARLLRLRAPTAPEPRAALDGVTIGLGLVLAAGVVLYALKALTEPMWANDFVAIWGLKGKTFFAEGRVPERLFLWKSLGFSHPEYPLGIPFLYAGIADLLGRWDDHAMALLFPLIQVATLLALFGWLRRRGATRQLALGAAALLSQFEPLYRGFTTGMAEVPLSFAMLLFGTSLCDRVDRTDHGAARRLVLASLMCAGTKNEGLFFVAAGLVVVALSALFRRGVFARAAALIALPAAVVAAAHRLLRRHLPLSDFDFSLFRRPGELVHRVGQTFAAVLRETPPLAVVGLAALVVLIAAGRHSPAGARLLALAACALAAYLFLPALAVAGPAWLVETAFFRTTAALAPLVAAGVAVRLVNGDRFI
ncbi:MAG TPA: hypothetical protein VGS98_17040 [Thermoanaerobaculia bacterium]|nr:hypothetical protein [Thermoanaerobaculia bacterium]